MIFCMRGLLSHIDQSTQNVYINVRKIGVYSIFFVKKGVYSILFSSKIVEKEVKIDNFVQNLGKTGQNHWAKIEFLEMLTLLTYLFFLQAYRAMGYRMAGDNVWALCGSMGWR